MCDTLYPDKFHMTVKENIFVAKRNIVDYIWKSANLEGIVVTYPETEAIYDGLSVAGMRVNDIIAINNLKHAWFFILDTLACDTDYPLICEINRKIGSSELIPLAGYLRTAPVSIGGTSWKPDMPIESQIKEQLGDISKITCTTDRAITLMLFCMGKQMFFDGNKRTAMLAANHILISNGAGIVSIPLEYQSEFRELLVNFYESGDMSEIKQFIYNFCIDGINFPRQPI